MTDTTTTTTTTTETVEEWGIHFQVMPCGNCACRAALVIEGWIYECSCGEHYQSVMDARRCRKCRTYTDEGLCTEVVNVATEATVWEIGVYWPNELAGALDKPREFRPTLADVWPASL